MITWLTAFIDEPAATFDRRTQFWQRITRTTASASRGDDGEFATLVPERGTPFLRLQRVVEGEGGIHLDLHMRSRVDADRTALELGATIVASDGHTILRSPAGLLFCHVGPEVEPSIPPTLTAPHRHALDQISIDIPHDDLDREVAFWAGLTGWSANRSTLRPEFTVLQPPEGHEFPLRLLLQQLGADDRSPTTRAHLDLACGDQREAIADHHEALGARRLATFDYWIAMEDPTGQPYCLTHRSPR